VGSRNGNPHQQGHAGVWVIQPYKGIVEAEDHRTGPAHAHTSMWVCACVHLWCWRGGSDGMVVPAGQLKNSAEWRIAIARDSRNT